MSEAALSSGEERHPRFSLPNWRAIGSEGLIFTLVAILLMLTSLRSYLFFHTLAELYSICIAATFFVIAWHTRRMNDNPSIAALGTSYLFVAVIDVFHTLTYSGMHILSGYDFAANQLWILARVLQAASLLIFSFVRRFEGRRLGIFFGAYALYTLAGLASILVTKVFPACYVPGIGQTPFKIGAEIFIIAVLAAASIAFRARRGSYHRTVYVNLQLSIWVTAVSELFFTLYISNYDLVNMIGHILKILSYYLVYRSVVVAGLERPNELLFARLNEKNDELVRSNEAKDTFISILSHDLRSPLGGIQGAASFLSENRSTLEGSMEEEWLREISSTASSTLALVENVLEWARCQSGTLAPEIATIDAVGIVREQARLHAEAAKAKGLWLDVEGPPSLSLRSDANMLSAILRNLLHNAIKYSNPGGRVVATVSAKDGTCCFAVDDTGIGMTRETIARLFRLDGRLRSTGTSGERGTGFGLILSHEFAKRLGGWLAVESEPGKGSTFRLALPLDLAPPPAKPRQ